MVPIKAHKPGIDQQGHPTPMTSSRTRTARIAVLTLAAVATVIAPLSSAEARKRWPRYHGQHHRAAIIGATALTAGVVIGATMARPRVVHRRAVVVDPGPVYVAPRRVYADPGYDVDAPLYDAPDYAEPGSYDDSAYQDEGQDEDLLYGREDDGEGVQDSDPDYYPPAPRRHADRNDTGEDVDTAGSYEPWSRAWKSWCSQRYRTFNATTGTYHGVDGRDHFCVAG